ncbi:hypothetical protein ACFC9N_11495 [Enterococcus casseliflavus]|uniref:hypothetical protein n=1 Tax=Enterococcus TaxID=1350 RepID=UPI000A3BC333|nr:hypothetical protein [Enterococcus sp. 4E1_DIV0656]OTO09313.1 hypothetical protein A5882_003646 [Enterococcus sp. 4E1_DIV0656]
MPTKPHMNTKNGYSLRVGKNLPGNAANLAYVQADTPSPEKNLLINDLTSQIPENKLSSGQKFQYEVFTKENLMVESQEGVNTFPRSDIDITDEYNVFSGSKEPLYFEASSRNLFDARLSHVYIYSGGSVLGSPKRFEEVHTGNDSQLLYQGNSIVVTKENGQALTSDEHYKIKLIKEGNEPFTYRIVIYSDFDSENNSYELHYPFWNGKRQIATTEYLNFTSIFEEVPIDNLVNLSEQERMSKKVFSISGDEAGGYRVYAPNPSNEFNSIERTAHFFDYQIKANLQTRLTEINPYEMKVGLVYLNTSTINQVNISGAGKKLFYDNTLFPKSISFVNPHRRPGYNDKSNFQYWIADLNMPKEHYLDYDLIILSGQGKVDLSKYNEFFISFLEAGGTLLVDSASQDGNHLNFKPINSEGIKFIRNINFSETENDNPRTYEPDAEPFLARYYNLTNPSMIGKSNSIIDFLDGENVQDWKIYLKHNGQGPSIIESNKQYNGRLVVSNAGLMLDVLFSNSETLKFITNYILYIVENKYVETPIFKEHVYHRDSLFIKEYNDENGNLVYVDDLNDFNQSQIVAKKILSKTVKDNLLDYVPQYLKKAEGMYHVEIMNDSKVPIENNEFEKTSTSGTDTWNNTHQNAIPSWSAIKFSGATSIFTQQSKEIKNGNYALGIEIASSRAFWEYELGSLVPGDYVLKVWTKASSQNNTPIGSSVGIYDSSGTMIAAAPNEATGFHWKQITIPFTLNSDTEAYIRLGAHGTEGTFTAYYDSVELILNNSVVMTPDGDGREELYAYAVNPKPQGLDITQWNQDNQNVVLENTPVTVDLQVKAIVYHWANEGAIYRKKYGNVARHRFTITKNQKMVELDKLISLIPSMNDGAEWADKSKVYYEISLLDTEDNKYINIELYDPSIEKHYYSADGNILINYDDLKYDSYHSTVSLRASTSFYGLRLLSRKYSLQLNERRKINVLYPGTTDERDRWYLQVSNGSFFKSGLNVGQLKDLNEAGRINYYSEHLIGEHEYSIPEYKKQAFYPEFGERKVQAELATYVDRKTIEVQKKPLLIREETVIKEELIATSNSRLIFQSRNNWWRKDFLPTIYWKESESSEEKIVNSGYKINFEDGLVEINDSELSTGFKNILSSGVLYASYKHDNFKIYKRKYVNEKVGEELLTTRDYFTFNSKNINWMTFPQPRLYRQQVGNEFIISPKEYYIDYEQGAVIFFEETRQRIYVDYGYYLEEELSYTDTDTRKGKIRLEKEISFQDEIYVSYIYKEDFLEYKGYYDDDNKVFHHLDLNPTTGHTYTCRQDIEGLTTYIELPTEKLLGKQIFLYLLPSTSTFNEITKVEENCLRHALSEKEWLKVKQTHVEAILLANIQVRENTNVENLIVMDARKYGGGIKEEISQEELEKYVGQTSAFWDIGSFDGLAYYRNSVLVLSIPASVLQSNGGQFSEQDVEGIVRKYVAFGSMPIIEYVKY